MTDVAIAGGGLAGLVAARYLAGQGHDVTVFERADAVGGRVRSREVDGFTLDRGFQVLFTGYPAVRAELDLDALDLRGFSPGATIARPAHRSTLADPFRAPTDAVASALNTDVTFMDKLTTLRLRRALRSEDPETLFDGPDETIREYLVRWGFSEAFLSKFAEPFYGGITLDRSLTTDAGVFRYTFAMLTRGETVVPADGMGAIPAQLADRAREAGAHIETGTPVRAVDAAGGEATVETDGESITADAVVVATDPHAARELTGVEAVPTEARSCVTQYFALDRRTLDTGRKLILNAAGERPNTVAPLSAVAPEYAPDGRTLLSAMTLGDPDAGDEELATAVTDALVTWYPEHRFDALEHLATDRVEFAQFDQPPGFRDDLPAVDAPDGPVYLAGDYTEWSSIQGAMQSGRAAADAAAEDL
ncbi:phytoene dehydrogenase [Halobacteriales archaeon QS_4_69_31]|nr:MAG: phytoene dehydrogenase [Halobacteriales archaeon QS_4_69_31]